jgi:hypothetical protein
MCYWQGFWDRLYAFGIIKPAIDSYKTYESPLYLYFIKGAGRKYGKQSLRKQSPEAQRIPG